MTVRPREATVVWNTFGPSAESYTMFLAPQQIWKAESDSNGFYFVRRNNVKLSLTRKSFERTFRVVEENAKENA